MKLHKSHTLFKFLKLMLFFIVLSSLLILSKSNFNIVRESVNLFLLNIIPSLFPFILFTEIILKTDILNLLTRLFGNLISIIFKIDKNAVSSILIGFLCGFPLGAKTVSTLYKENKISKKDGYILLSFINNCNPAFILSTIGIGIFNNIKIGLILLIAHLTSSILIGLIYSRIANKSRIYIDSTNNIIHKKDKKINNTPKKSENIDFFSVIKSSISNSFVTLGNILGFIIIFNLLSNYMTIFLEKLNTPPIFNTFISALFEITNGCFKINLIDINFRLKICLISFALGFSGFCIICQIYSMIFEEKFKFTHLLKYKFIHGVLSSIITYFIITFILQDTDIYTLNVFSNIENANAEYTYYINNMKISYLISTFAILLILLIYYIYNKYKVVKRKEEKLLL